MSVSAATTLLPTFYAATKTGGVGAGVYFPLLVVALLVGAFLFSRPTRRKPGISALSSEGALRVRSALESLVAVDPKARKELDSRIGDAARLFQMLAPQEEITWLQCALLATDGEGQVNRFTFASGILGITTRNLIFVGNTRSRNGHWPLVTLTTVDLFRNGLFRGSDLLQVGAGATRIGFGLSNHAAAEELVNRLRSSIAQASNNSSAIGFASSAEELAKWAKLRSEGIITDEEFNVRSPMRSLMFGNRGSSADNATRSSAVARAPL